MNVFCERVVVLALTVSVAATVTADQPGDHPDVIAIENVSLLTMSDARILKHQTVVIRDGLIDWLGPAQTARLENNIRRIDGRDKYLMPGLIDSHVHLEHFDAVAQLQLFLAHGVTAVRNMDGRPLVLKWREQVNEGTVAGPDIVTAGPILDGSPPIWEDSLTVTNAEEAYQRVREIAAAGFDQIKVYDRLSAEAYEGIALAARRHNLPVVGHVPGSVGLAGAIRADQASIEHLSGFAGYIEAEGQLRPWHPHKRFLGTLEVDGTKLVQAVVSVAQSGIWICPTLVMHEMSYVTRESRLDWYHTYNGVSLSLSRTLLWLVLSYSYLEVGEPREVGAARRLRKTLVADIASHGGGILMGTDAGIPFVVPGASAHLELELLVSAGLPPYEALRSATINADRFFHRNAGHVAEGRRADLVLLKANPLDDVRHIRAIAGVMQGGRWFDREAISDIIQEVAW